MKFFFSRVIGLVLFIAFSFLVIKDRGEEHGISGYTNMNSENERNFNIIILISNRLQ